MFVSRFTLRSLFLLGALAAVVAMPATSAVAQERDTLTTSTSTAEAEGYFAEPHAIGKGIDFAVRTMGNDSGAVKNGFYPEMGAMVTGAGWISAGPGYRRWLFSDTTLIDMSAAYSWRGYKAAQARVEFPSVLRSRVTFGSSTAGRTSRRSATSVTAPTPSRISAASTD